MFRQKQWNLYSPKYCADSTCTDLPVLPPHTLNRYAIPRFRGNSGSDLIPLCFLRGTAHWDYHSYVVWENTWIYFSYLKCCVLTAPSPQCLPFLYQLCPSAPINHHNQSLSRSSAFSGPHSSEIMQPWSSCPCPPLPNIWQCHPWYKSQALLSEPWTSLWACATFHLFICWWTAVSTGRSCPPGSARSPLHTQWLVVFNFSRVTHTIFIVTFLT